MCARCRISCFGRAENNKERIIHEARDCTKENTIDRCSVTQKGKCACRTLTLLCTTYSSLTLHSHHLPPLVLPLLSSPPKFPCVLFTHIVASDVLSPNSPPTQYPNALHRACVRPHAHRLRPMLQVVLQHLVCALRTSATTEASFPDRPAIASDPESASSFQSAPFHSDQPRRLGREPRHSILFGVPACSEISRGNQRAAHLSPSAFRSHSGSRRTRCSRAPGGPRTLDYMEFSIL